MYTLKIMYTLKCELILLTLSTLMASGWGGGDIQYMSFKLSGIQRLKFIISIYFLYAFFPRRVFRCVSMNHPRHCCMHFLILCMKCEINIKKKMNFFISSLTTNEL